MSKFYARILSLLLIWIPLGLAGQNLTVNPAGPVIRPSGPPVHAGPDILCAPDTIYYTQFKSTGLVLLNVNNANSAQGMYQYYDCPQEMTIYGVRFFAYAPNQNNPVQVTVEIYKSSADTLPTGAPLAIDTVLVDSSHGLFTLAELTYDATFSTPLTVDEPYIIVIANHHPQGISVVTGDYTVDDGNGEWLSGCDFRHQPGGTWTRGYDVNVGANDFDADVLLLPMVEYDLQSGIVADSTCLLNTDTVCFSQVSSPIVTNRMYSYYAFLSIVNSCFAWDFGDFSGLTYQQNVCHAYTTNGPFTVQLYTNLYGWTSSCGASTSIIIGNPGLPIPDFNPVVNGITVGFQNTSSGAATNQWTFGDGGTSTSVSPIHVYPGNGSYPVSLIVANGCGVDTLLDTIIINCTPPVADFNWTNNFLGVNFTNGSSGGSSYSWLFGDGGTSALNNPNHVYPSYGSYLVTLIVYSDCGNDTLQDSITLVQPAGIHAGLPQYAVNLSPNPAQDQLLVDLSRLPQPALISLSNLTGAQLQSLMSEGNRRETLQLQDLPAGLYLVTVTTTEGQRWTGRIAIQR